MLLNKIADTRKTFEEYNQLDSRLQQVKKVHSFSQFTKKELNTIKSILGSYHALHEMDPPSFPKRDMSYEFKRLNAVIQNGLEKYNKDEISGFTFVFKKLDQDLKTRWTFYVRTINQDIIGLLERMQHIAGNPQDIKQLISDLNKFETKWPVNTLTLSNYNNHLEKARKVMSDMNASKGVQDFIGKVASNNATIDDLSDEVIQWLREQQLTNKLVIKFK
ncbi:hypothetical protein QF028_002704 [Neobacillus sp. B4I6]|uniref:hypothetical protein n=1 Tax=Neobacillus sp. B4I6 TaxID=3373925 RepID=UPI003D1F8450